jgi:hypothetical protein
MKLREFILSLSSLAAAPFALMGKAVHPLQPPVQAWPWHDGKEIVGLWAQSWDYDEKRWGGLYLITAEFDDDKDNPYKGQYLMNPWRNKFWGVGMVSKKRTLLCINKWETGIRFFHNHPNTDWSLAYPVAV